MSDWLSAKAEWKRFHDRPMRSFLYEVRMYLKHVDALVGSRRDSAFDLRARYVKAEAAVREYERRVSEQLLRPDDVYMEETNVFSDLADVLNRYKMQTGQ